MFIVLSGVSSSGKNTIMNELIKKRKNLKVLNLSSGTTRAPRPTDSENNTYLFLSKEEFEKGIKEGKFFEYELVHGNYYGLILERLKLAKYDKENDYIRDIDVKGNLSLKKFFDRNEMISIFIDAPDEILRERLKNRGDSEEDIEKRLSRGEFERSYKNHYDLVIENIDLEKTVNLICDFIDNFKKNA